MEKVSLRTKILNALFLVFLIALIYRFLNQLFEYYGYESYAVSEFLINYKGGFVRRGLLGEILFFLVERFNISPQVLIKIISAGSYLLVCSFFVYFFKKKRYPLYILPLCFFCGALVVEYVFWIRKDSLMICFFIAILLIWQNWKTFPKMPKIVLINLLSIFILLVHEVFGFFTFPILFLLLFNSFKEKGMVRSIILSFISILPALGVFAFTFLMKGDGDVAQKIWDSWHLLTNPGEIPPPVHWNSAIGAIGWDAKDTLKSHFTRNFFDVDHGIISMVYWMFLFPVVYYISTNALMVFRKRQEDYTEKHRTILSSVILFQWVCLLPLFTILSIDYMRLFFYLTTTSFALFLLIPLETLEKLLPEFIMRIAQKINYFINKLFPPSKYILVLLMLFVGISSYAFTIEMTYSSTMLYHVLFILSKPFLLLRNVVFSILGL